MCCKSLAMVIILGNDYVKEMFVFCSRSIDMFISSGEKIVKPKQLQVVVICKTENGNFSITMTKVIDR